ncbi:MAG TPA: hypothetical protein VKV37_23215 [Ktedonobacteraceae bacterium]|nr:hypothetical protein [Ktedonobacteraceae bacterium]
MSDTNGGVHEPARQSPRHDPQAPAHPSYPDVDPRLEAALISALERQAAQVPFPPALREHIVGHLPPRHVRRAPRRLALGLAAALVIALSLSLTLLLWRPQPAPLPTGQALAYQVERTIPAPPSLSKGVSVIALDPTGHHLVYEPVNQPGVMYTADLSDPTATNVLAMREAHSASWAPDGSALVTVVTPPGAAQPLLALVPYGKYMSPLGPHALAADWSPAGQSITYVTQEKGPAALWATTRDGHPTHLLAKMSLSLPVQRLLWSPDGKHLALVVAGNGPAGPTALSQPGRAIYLMDRQSGRLQELVAPGDFTIGTLAWSPDSRLLTYERLSAEAGTSLQAINVATAQTRLAIPIHHALAGWSWSPDSRTLIYSDGGALRARTLSGPRIVLPATRAQQTFPNFLRDGRILLLQSTPTGEELVLLHPKTE